MSEIIIVYSKETAALDPTQSGFAHGFGVFETMKLVDGRLCFWKAHWNRLLASARFFELELPFAADAVLAAIRKLVSVDVISDGMIKLSLMRDGAGTRLFVYARAAAAVPSTASLKLDEIYPINQRSLLAGHKTHNYMENMALYQSARAEGFFDTLRMNTNGEIAETTTGNFFFIKNGQLCTPSLDSGILPGVIRGDLLKLCDVSQARYRLDDLKLAEAAFMTNSSCGLLAIDRLVGAESTLEWESRSHPLFDELSILLAAAEGECLITL